MSETAFEPHRGRRRGRRRTSGERHEALQRRHRDASALIVFALIVAAAPLAFGAVDRVVQVGLLGLLAAGLILNPPVIDRPSGRGWLWIALLAGLLVGKEFAPAALFGSTRWRTIVTGSYGVALPWTHHPEPGRAVDGQLAALVAVVWFVWVRTLARSRGNRVVIAWALFGAAALVAGVSFATQGMSAEAIYGMRYTPGWRGFGPFPNRNHTASFLAMGGLIGCGCVMWAGTRGKRLALGGGVVLLILDLWGLLATQSRGGLLAFAVGMATLVAFALAYFRTGRAVVGGVLACLLLGALTFSFGGPVLQRFAAAESEGSNAMRRHIWHDASTMWQDAPLFGHGLGSFSSIFPLYQQVELDDMSVLHPESSWWQWLTELGALPVAIAIVLFAAFVLSHGREMFRHERGFYLRAAGFAAVACLLFHGLIDVPAHRWATFGFGLAALGLACPRGGGEENTTAEPDRAKTLRKPLSQSWKIAGIPLAAAAFWLLPIMSDGPSWSPLALSRLLTRAESGGLVTGEELAESSKSFPLQPVLHVEIGTRLLVERGRFSDEWQKHFQFAARLTPGSWRMPISLAEHCEAAAPGHAIHYWQLAIERAGFRREGLFIDAVNHTAKLPGAADAWESYVEVHPELMAVYAHSFQGDAGRGWYERWWNERANRREALPKEEVEAFYDLAAKWGTPEQLDEWMTRHPELRSRDFQAWARLLHQWKKDAAAWDLLAARIPDPEFPAAFPRITREQLEEKWRINPGNAVTGQALAQILDHEGDAAGAREIVFAVARRNDAPPWFTRKAAYFLAADGDAAASVAMLLR